MPTIDATRLRDFTAVLQKYKSGKASLERRVVAAENWWKLRNQFEESRGGLRAEQGYQSASGWLHNVIVSKHADAMDAFPEPIILPREPGDREQARLLSAILPCILEQNRFERVYDHAMWQKLKTGTACYRVVWDGEKCGGLGDIAIERVDLLNLFWEPGISDIQKSRYLFCTHLEDEETLETRYPQLKGRLRSNPFLATRFVYDDAVSLEGKATVIEVYYKKPLPGGGTVLHYCKYVGDTVLYATENENAVILSEARQGEPKDPERVFTSAQDDRKRCHPERAQRAEGSSPNAGKDPSTAASPPLRMTEAPPLPAAEAGEASVPQPSENARNSVSPQRFPLTARRANGVERVSSDVDEGLYAHGKYPFVFDPLFPVEGSPCGYGFVDLCANNQTAIDLLRTASLLPAHRRRGE